MVGVVPVDLGGEHLVGLFPASDRFHGEKRGEAFLPEAELALDLAFGLRILGNQMAYAEAAQRTLELGEGVGVAGLARFVAEETQAVGVEVVGKAVGEEDFPDMGEVGEGGFGLDEARPDDETGGVVDGQGEDLELLPRPPLVRGAVVLQEIAIAFALPSAARFGAAFEGVAQQPGHMVADMAADVGGGAFEAETAGEFVGQEAEVGGFARGEGDAQEGLRLFRPRAGVITSRWGERETAACGQPEGSEGVEAGSPDSEPDTCVARGEAPVVERGEGFLDDSEGQAMEKLFVFIWGLEAREPSTDERHGALPQTPEFIESGRMAPGKASFPRSAVPVLGAYRTIGTTRVALQQSPIRSGGSLIGEQWNR